NAERQAALEAAGLGGRGNARGGAKSGNGSGGALSFADLDAAPGEDDGSSGNGVPGGDGTAAPAAGQKESRQRKYRSRPGPDTPSHPGGVNREAKDKIDEKERARRRGG
ncbi:unnamed protein product, partial [Ectocarpus sp. 12 AP-2014]